MHSAHAAQSGDLPQQTCLPEPLLLLLETLEFNRLSLDCCSILHRARLTCQNEGRPGKTVQCRRGWRAQRAGLWKERNSPSKVVLQGAEYLFLWCMHFALSRQVVRSKTLRTQFLTETFSSRLGSDCSQGPSSQPGWNLPIRCSKPVSRCLNLSGEVQQGPVDRALRNLPPLWLRRFSRTSGRAARPLATVKFEK